MGGYTSGRDRWRNFGTIEATRELDLRHLKKAGYLEPGWQGRLLWVRGGSVTAWINLQVGFEYVDFIFPMHDANARQYEARQTVRLIHVPCPFGGSRPYFRCPGTNDDVCCGRHVTKLYWPAGGYILCRHCHRLTYASQSEDKWDRAYRRADKIKARLGWQPGSPEPFPSKPKGMHWQTYERLRSDAIEAELKGEEKLSLYEEKLVRQSQH